MPSMPRRPWSRSRPAVEEVLMNMSGWIGSLLAILLVAAIPAAALAEKAPIRREFFIGPNPFEVPGDFATCFGADAAGAGANFVVVWDQCYEVFSRRLDSFGGALAPPVQASSGSSSPTTGTAVGSSASGRFVVAWDDYDASAVGDPQGSGIIAQRYDASGAAAGSLFLVNTSTPGYQNGAKVAADDSGNFVVVWAEYYYDGSLILGQRYASSGTALGGQFQVNTNTICCNGNNGYFEIGAEDISVAADGAGGFMVVWADAYDDILGRVYDSTGGAVGGDFVVNSYTTDYQYTPDVAADNTGGFVVAWLGTDAAGPYGAHARRFDSAGTPLGAQFRVNGDGYYSDDSARYAQGGGARVAAGPAGNFVVVWAHGGDTFDYDDGANGIFAREFDSTGTPVGGSFRVDETIDSPGYPYQFRVRRPDVAANAAGEFIVVWSQYVDPFGGDHAIGRRLGEAVACTTAPKTGCREPTVAKRGVLRFTHGSTPARSSLTWRWVKGDAADFADFGDPFTTDPYAFCVYDSSVSPQPLISAAVPAGGACGNLPCWRELSGQRVNYYDKNAFVGGVRLIQMVPGVDGKARTRVRAKGANLELPATPLALPVTAQIQVANGECWTASYSAFIKRNDGGVFRAHPDAGSPSGAFLDGAASPLD
jgi:hypothetical protein